MPGWILQWCPECGGLHRSRWHAAQAHGQASVPRRSKRFTKKLDSQMTKRERGRYGR